MKRLLSFTSALAAMLLMLASPTQVQATSQTTDFDCDDRSEALASFDGSAYLEAANGEVFIHVSLTDINGDGTDRIVNVQTSDKASEGAHAPFPRAQTLATNGFAENENEKGCSNTSVLPFPARVTGPIHATSLAHTEPTKFYVAEKSHNDQRRAYTRRTRSQATT